VKGLVVPLVLVIAAEAAARVFGVASDNLAAPSAILAAFWTSLQDGSLVRHTAETMSMAVAGLCVGGSIGLLLAILLGLFKPVAKLLDVPIEMVRPIPSAAMLPVVLLIFGFGFRMEIALVAFACVWPLVIIGRSAIAGVQPRLIEVSRVLKFGFFHHVTKIVLPAALPRLFVAVRFAAGLALIMAVTTEIVANPFGLGYDLIKAQQSLNPALMFTDLLWVGLLGFGLNVGLSAVQHWLFDRKGRVASP
jgi:ABC-type nitrate/sulfonate/bicarbonate transport system permease component